MRSAARPSRTSRASRRCSASWPTAPDVTKLRPRSAETGHTLPWLIEPETATAPLITDLAPRIRGELDEKLLKHGALLFRGFAIDGPRDFQAFADAIGSVRDYVGGNSPRSEILDRVYSSTEYPRSLEIALHNEMAYLG